MKATLLGLPTNPLCIPLKYCLLSLVFDYKGLLGLKLQFALKGSSLPRQYMLMACKYHKPTHLHFQTCCKDQSRLVHIHKHLLAKQTNKIIVKTSKFHLIEALKKGNVFHNVPSSSKEILFQEVSSRMDLPKTIKVCLTEQLLQRENISSTGIGNGFAIPHPKTPLGVQINQTVVGTFFLQSPLNFNAPDGLQVTVVFVLLSKDSAHHLQLLSQLVRLLGNASVNELLDQSPSLEILIAKFEKTLEETT